MIKYTVILKEGDKTVGTYHLEADLFQKIFYKLKPYKSAGAKPKQIKCVETGEVFRCANEAAKILRFRGLTNSYSADARIKISCKNKKNAYGYHWEFVRND